MPGQGQDIHYLMRRLAGQAWDILGKGATRPEDEYIAQFAPFVNVQDDAVRTKLMWDQLRGWAADASDRNRQAFAQRAMNKAKEMGLVEREGVFGAVKEGMLDSALPFMGTKHELADTQRPGWRAVGGLLGGVASMVTPLMGARLLPKAMPAIHRVGTMFGLQNAGATASFQNEGEAEKAGIREAEALGQALGSKNIGSSDLRQGMTPQQALQQGKDALAPDPAYAKTPLWRRGAGMATSGALGYGMGVVPYKYFNPWLAKKGLESVAGQTGKQATGRYLARSGANALPMYGAMGVEGMVQPWAAGARREIGKNPDGSPRTEPVGLGPRAAWEMVKADPWRALLEPLGWGAAFGALSKLPGTHNEPAVAPGAPEPVSPPVHQPLVQTPMGGWGQAGPPASPDEIALQIALASRHARGGVVGPELTSEAMAKARHSGRITLPSGEEAQIEAMFDPRDLPEGMRGERTLISREGDRRWLDDTTLNASRKVFDVGGSPAELLAGESPHKWMGRQITLEGMQPATIIGENPPLEQMIVRVPQGGGAFTRVLVPKEQWQGNPEIAQWQQAAAEAEARANAAKKLREPQPRRWQDLPLAFGEPTNEPNISGISDEVKEAVLSALMGIRPPANR